MDKVYNFTFFLDAASEIETLELLGSFYLPHNST